jgi:uncharacterized protein
MILDLSRIISGKVSNLPFEFSYEIKKENFKRHEVISASPLGVKGEIINSKGVLKIEYQYFGSLSFKCGRCLEEIEFDITDIISRRLVNEDFVDEDQTDMVEDIYYIESAELDLGDFIENEIFVAIPLQILCKEDCKGLCSSCGANQNFGSCNCKDEKIDPRLEELQNFFK